jgi:hypothetical protein
VLNVHKCDRPVSICNLFERSPLTNTAFSSSFCASRTQLPSVPSPNITNEFRFYRQVSKEFRGAAMGHILSERSRYEFIEHAAARTFPLFVPAIKTLYRATP